MAMSRERIEAQGIGVALRGVIRVLDLGNLFPIAHWSGSGERKTSSDLGKPMRLQTTKHNHDNQCRMIRAAWKTTSQALLSVTLLVLFSSPAFSYADYDGCKACHGDFKGDDYISKSDGTAWGQHLMDGHESFVDECDACHQSDENAGVYLNSSFDSSLSKSCVGCHGRQEDVNGSCSLAGGGIAVECGSGAGLRQIHDLKIGAGTCGACHSGDPAPVGEDIVPFNYGKSGVVMIDPCDADSTESYFGASGLDNDGDGFADGSDSDCLATPTPVPAMGPAATVSLGALLLVSAVAAAGIYSRRRPTI